MKRLVVAFMAIFQGIKRVLIPFLLVVFISCQKENKTEAISEKPDTISIVQKEIPAVCIWDQASLRAEPSRKGKWLSAMALGEKITWLNEAKVDSSDHKRKYLRIRLSDGTEGWASEYVVATDAYPAVLTEEASIYRRPDLLTITDEEFDPMDLVAVTQSKDDWIDVKGKENKKNGWIQANQISSKDEDIAVALLASKALSEKDEEKKRKKIKFIVNNTGFAGSVFMNDLKEKLSEFSQEEAKDESDSLTIMQ